MNNRNELYDLIFLASDMNSKQFGKRVFALGEIKKFDARDILVNCHQVFNEATDEQAKAIITSIAVKVNFEEAFPLILKLLQAQKGFVRADAVGFLGYGDLSKTRPLFLNIIRTDPDPSVRYWAIYRLGEVGDISVIESLHQIYLFDNGIAEDFDHDGETFYVPLKQEAEKAIRKIRRRMGEPIE